MQPKTPFRLACVLASVLPLAACSDDRGGSIGPTSTVGGQMAAAAGTTSTVAGNGGPGVGTSGASGGGSAGRPAVSGTGGTPVAMSGATAAGTGAGGMMAATGGSNAAGAPAAGAPAAGSAGGAPDPNATGCDRACLIDFMKGYTDALIAKDPSKLKVSANLKYTENGVTAKLGDSVWKTAMSLVTDTVLTFADPTEGQVATQFVFTESASVQKIYQVRLKVVAKEITEIESMLVVNGDQFFRPAGMKPEPVFLQMIDPAKRTSREQLKAITELYLGYLEGKKRASEVPFDTTCKRYENGTATANGLSSFNAQSWSFQVTHRILVIDEEAGITWGMFPFQQTATALVVGEAFKIIDGKIMMIQAVMTNMPTKAWD
jgi:hypothetical protein